MLLTVGETWNMEIQNWEVPKNQGLSKKKEERGGGFYCCPTFFLFFAHYNDNEFEAVKHTCSVGMWMHHSDAITAHFCGQYQLP